MLLVFLNLRFSNVSNFYSQTFLILCVLILIKVFLDRMKILKSSISISKKTSLTINVAFFTIGATATLYLIAGNTQAPLTFYSLDQHVSSSAHYNLILDSLIIRSDYTYSHERLDLVYGPSIPLFVKLTSDLLQILQIDHTSISLIRIWNVMLTMLVLSTFCLLNRKRVGVLFFVWIILSPFIYSHNAYYPNLTGIRYFPIFLSIFLLSLLLIKGSNEWRKTNLVITSLLLITSSLISVEFLLPFILALILTTFFMNRIKKINGRQVSQLCVLLAILIIINLVVQYSLLPDLLGYSGKNGNPDLFLAFIHGYGGLKITSLAVFSVLLLTIYLVLSRALQKHKRHNCGSLFLLTVFCLFFLFWAPYYLNRSAHDNLWFSVTIFLMVIGLFSNMKYQEESLQKSTRGIFMISGVVITALVLMNLVSIRGYVFNQGSQEECMNDTKQLGICLNYVEASSVLKHLEAAKYFPKESVVLTLFPREVAQLSKAHLPVGDIMLSPKSVEKLEELIRYVNESGVDTVFIESSEEGVLNYNAVMKRYFSYIQGKLSNYQISETDDGWTTLKVIRHSHKK